MSEPDSSKDLYYITYSWSSTMYCYVKLSNTISILYVYIFIHLFKFIFIYDKLCFDSPPPSM